MVRTLAFTCYLLFKLTIWTFDYLNTKYLHISSTGLTYLKTLTLDKTNIYLQLYDFTTCESVDMYMGTILGNPDDIYTVRDILLQGQYPLTKSPLMTLLI